jgi:hypothetical protein
MFTVSTRTLNILAALIWYIGGLVLLLKAASLLLEANALRPAATGPWLAGLAGLLFGSLKARYLFSRSCRKNLARIAALRQPRIWQCFRPKFFAALALMILAGAISSRLAHQHYPLLIGVGTLDLSLATALFGSSVIFWRQNAVAGLTGSSTNL